MISAIIIAIISILILLVIAYYINSLRKKEQGYRIPDDYSKNHITRVKDGMNNESLMEQRWKNEIEPFLPSNTLPNGIAAWTARIFFVIVSLPANTTGYVKDEYNHISHNRYALLDFCIYGYFEIRRNLCSVLYPKIVYKIDDLYFEYLKKYFEIYFDISQNDANIIIDERLYLYEEILNENTETSLETELIEAALDFLVKDFSNGSMDNTILILSPDQKVALYKELYGFIVAEHNFMKKRLFELPKNCFLEKYQSKFPDVPY